MSDTPSSSSSFTSSSFYIIYKLPYSLPLSFINAIKPPPVSSQSTYTYIPHTHSLSDYLPNCLPIVIKAIFNSNSIFGWLSIYGSIAYVFMGKVSGSISHFSPRQSTSMINWFRLCRRIACVFNRAMIVSIYI